MSDLPASRTTFPSRERPIQQSRIRFIVELLSIAGGACFLLSVVVQQLLFMLWKVDFTAIASIEDVVLGGVRLLVLIILMMVLFCPLVLIIAHFTAENKKFSLKCVPDVLRVALIGGMAVSALYFCVYHNFYYDTPFSLFETYATLYIVTFGAEMAALLVTILTSSISLSTALTMERDRIFKLGALAVLLSVLVMLPTYIRLPYTSLSVANEDILPAECRFGGGKGLHWIKWVGSRAILIECLNKSYVILHEDTDIAFRVSAAPEFETFLNQRAALRAAQRR